METLNYIDQRRKVVEFATMLLKGEFNSPTAYDVVKAVLKKDEDVEEFLLKRYKKELEKQFDITILNDSITCFFYDRNELSIRLYENIFSATGNIKVEFVVDTLNQDDHKHKVEKYLEQNRVLLISNNFKYISYQNKKDCRLL